MTPDPPEPTDVRVESRSSGDRLIIPHPVRHKREERMFLTLPDAMTKAIVREYIRREKRNLAGELLAVLEENQQPVNDGRIDWNDCGNSEECE